MLISSFAILFHVLWFPIAYRKKSRILLTLMKSADRTHLLHCFVICFYVIGISSLGFGLNLLLLEPHWSLDVIRWIPVCYKGFGIVPPLLLLLLLLLFLLSWYRTTAGGCWGTAALLSRYRLALLSRNGLTLLSGDVLAALLRDLARLRSALLTRDGEASLARDSHRNRFALLPIHRAALLSRHRAERLKSWRDAVLGGHNSGHILVPALLPWDRVALLAWNLTLHRSALLARY